MNIPMWNVRHQPADKREIGGISPGALKSQFQSIHHFLHKVDIHTIYLSWRNIFQERWGKNKSKSSEKKKSYIKGYWIRKEDTE